MLQPARKVVPLWDRVRNSDDQQSTGADTPPILHDRTLSIRPPGALSRSSLRFFLYLFDYSGKGGTMWCIVYPWL
jgi:hypothetical protein